MMIQEQTFENDSEETVGKNGGIFRERRDVLDGEAADFKRRGQI